MGVDRLLQLLAAGAERRRCIERHVDAADRAQRQTIERDVNQRFHCWPQRRRIGISQPVFALDLLVIGFLLRCPVPRERQPAVVARELGDFQRAGVFEGPFGLELLKLDRRWGSLRPGPSGS